jgi:hypothetical protein
MMLTTLLSRPLRHLEKYAGNAQELEQHLEDDHPDRGDTQRSVSFYKNVAVSFLVSFETLRQVLKISKFTVSVRMRQSSTTKRAGV